MTFLILKYLINLSKYIITLQDKIFYSFKYLQEEDKDVRMSLNLTPFATKER